MTVNPLSAHLETNKVHLEDKMEVTSDKETDDDDTEDREVRFRTALLV